MEAKDLAEVAELLFHSTLDAETRFVLAVIVAEGYKLKTKETGVNHVLHGYPK